jgi:hypothetical protein
MQAESKLRLMSNKAARTVRWHQLRRSGGAASAKLRLSIQAAKALEFDAKAL